MSEIRGYWLLNCVGQSLKLSPLMSYANYSDVEKQLGIWYDTFPGCVVKFYDANKLPSDIANLYLVLI